MALYQQGREVTRAAFRSGTLVSRSVELPTHSVRDLTAISPPPHVVWMPPTGPVTVGVGAAVTITTSGRDRMRRVKRAAESVFESADVDAIDEASQPRVFGGFSFHSDHEPAEPWTGFPGAKFILPAEQFTIRPDSVVVTHNEYGQQSTETFDVDRIKQRLTDTKPARPGAQPGVDRMVRTPSRAQWEAQVGDALTKIRQGTLRKIVLAQSLRVDLNGDLDPLAVLSDMESGYESCHRFMFAPTDRATLFGATPERLVSTNDGALETEALAGSIRRGEDAEDDEALTQALLDSDKEQTEHELVVSEIREQLAPYTEAVRLGDRRVRKLPSVQHLETSITADLAAPEHVLSLVEALHPTPAVGGLPPETAQRIIRETERFNRGWYAAPIGWFDADGDGEFVVGIRSAVGHGRQATLYAGAGIVPESSADTEWSEVQLKYRPILDALAEPSQ